MLADKIEHYNKYQKRLNNTPAQYKSEFEWLKEVDSLALSNAQLNLQSAYNNFFRDKKVGFPKYKSKKCNKHSYTTNYVNGNIFIRDGKIKLPKVGFVKMKQHRIIPESYKLKAVTVSQTPSNKYYVSILFEYENQVHKTEPQKFLGLDFSMHELYVASDGTSAQYPRFYRQALKRLEREQHKLSKMQKGSNNRNKQRIRVARLHEKVANQRKDFLHKQSRQITNAYDCVCIEDLNMGAMSHSLNFGKSVADNGWGMFTTFLQYKLEDVGKQLVKIDRFFASSQLCSACGYQNSETKDLSVREWTCPRCQTHHDRDVNAAINIRNEGMKIALA
jgi:putative transposase